MTTAVGGVDDEGQGGVRIQQNGKLVIAGYSYNATRNAYEMVVIRYKKTGELAPSFGNKGIVTTAVGSVDDGALDVILQPDDGKIVVSGTSFNSVTGFYEFVVARYLAQGFDE